MRSSKVVVAIAACLAFVGHAMAGDIVVGVGILPPSKSAGAPQQDGRTDSTSKDKLPGTPIRPRAHPGG